MTPSKMEALRRINLAMLKIERAQQLMSDAAQELSCITGLVDNEWERVGDFYDSLKAVWHHVNLRRNTGGYDLDSDAKLRLEQANAKREGA